MITCRLCLCKNREKQSFLVVNKEELIMKIKDCVSIEIKDSDNLPKTVCQPCLKKINDWDEFRAMCLLSEELLLDGIRKQELVLENQLLKADPVKLEVVQDELWKPFDFNSDLPDSDPDEFLDEDYFNNEIEDIKINLADSHYTCELCTKEFNYCLDYLEHQDEHDGEPVFNCDKCNVVFNSKRELADHEKSHKRPCPYCGKPILKQSMKLHVNQHTDKFVCEHCSHRFNSKATLRQHIITVHTNIKNHICETCGKRFSSKTSINVHLKSHRAERAYRCKVCNYAGRTASAIYIHMSKHANEVHVCEMCSKSFKSSRNLNDHLRRVHSKEKKHVCVYCKKKFVDKYMLSVHMRIHTGVRPYKCQLCEKTFIRSDSLKEHMQTHDKNTFYECQTCTKKFTSKRGRIRHRCTGSI